MKESEPHPQLIPLLEKYGIDWKTFSKRGRIPAGSVGVSEKRAAIVTELHSAGTSWSDMMAITGLSNGSIQRLTGAMWNPESRKRVSENGIKTGRSWGGKHRPGQLEAQWAAGNFDSLRGRVRTEDERAKLRAGWTTEKRENIGIVRKALWEDSDFREPLLEFHRSPEERTRRSVDQTTRMLQDPIKWCRGKGGHVDTPKGTTDNVYVRSSYEKATILVLESDPEVISYQFEPRFTLSDGRWILPDFLVHTVSGDMLIEVKASWVLNLPPEDKVQLRLGLSRKVAEEHGWGFAIWTEKKELKDALKNSTRQNPFSL